MAVVRIRIVYLSLYQFVICDGRDSALLKTLFEMYDKAFLRGLLR